METHITGQMNLRLDQIDLRPLNAVISCFRMCVVKNIDMFSFDTASAVLCGVDDSAYHNLASVRNDARVYGDAEIFKTSDYFTSGPIGSRNDTITFFRCKDGKIRATTGCFYGDLDQLEAAVRSKHKNNNYAQAYMGVIAAAKAQMGADQNV